MIEPNKAGRKPLTTKPGVIEPASQIVRAFKTNRNKPKVRNVIGRVRSTKIGLTMALSKPKTTAATRAAKKLVIANPCTRLAVITNAKAVTSQVNKKCGMTFVKQRLQVSYLESDLFVLCVHPAFNSDLRINALYGKGAKPSLVST